MSIHSTYFNDSFLHWHSNYQSFLLFQKRRRSFNIISSRYSFSHYCMLVYIATDWKKYSCLEILNYWILLD